MEAIHEALSATTSLPTATQRLCGYKSAAVAACTCLLRAVWMWRGCFALSPAFSGDAGLTGKTPQLNQTLLLEERRSKEHIDFPAAIRDDIHHAEPENQP